MRRRIRHARRVLGYGALVVLILAAVLVGALNQLLPLVERHPENVAAWLSERVGEPVTFSRATGEWTRRGPRFTLDDLRIGEGERTLDIGRAELLVSVYSGLLPDQTLTELKVRDLSLALEQGADRRWKLAGLPFEPRPDTDPLDLLQNLGELQVEHARLVVRSPALSRELTIPRVDLRLQVYGEHLRAGVRAWADPRGTPLSAVATLQRRDWSGELWAGGDALRLAEWSPLLADTGLVVAGGGRIDLWARIDAQRVQDVRARAELSPLALVSRTPWLPRDDGTAVAPPVSFERADVLARWQVDDNGWQLHAPQLHFHATGREQPHRFDGLWLAGGQRFAMTAPRLDLGTAQLLATLSDDLPAGLRRWLHEAAPEGELRGLAVSGGDGRWSGGAYFDAVGWSPRGNGPGLQGLTGSAAFDQDGGVLRLDDVAAAFEGTLFRQPLPLRLDGTLGWWRDGDGWTAGAAGLDVRGEDFGTTVRAELQFQGDGSRPRLDLAADVHPSHVPTAGKFWVVGKMPPATIEWLDNALLEGDVVDGRAVLAGDLDHWPFRDHSGRFDARARVQNARVAFHRDWPAAEGLDVDVSFDGPGMALADGAATLHGNRVQRFSGAIPDFKDPVLTLDIDTPARAEQLQALLLVSPLRAKYEEHLTNARMAGPATVALDLHLPLAARLGQSRIDGTLSLAGATLADPRWNLDFREVSGDTRFSGQGFQAEALAVQLDGEPATFGLAVGAPYTGDPALAAHATLRGTLPPQLLLARHEPLAWLHEWLQGRSEWFVDVRVPAVPEGQPQPPARLRVESDLAGTAVTLPAPLDKPADVVRPLRVEASLPLADGEISLALGESLMTMRARAGADDALAGVITLGGESTGALPAQGLVVRGRSPSLDAAGWVAFAAKGDGTGGLREVDLQVDRLDLLGSPFADTTLRLQRGEASTQITLDGEGVSGRIDVPSELARGVQGRFARLHWPERPPPDPAALAAAEEGRSDDPGKLPPLRFHVEDLRVGTLVLGRAEFAASPVPDGLRIERFSTHSPTLELLATGDWLRAGDGRSRSEFEANFQAGALGELLTAFGLAGMVDDGPTQGRLDGSWPGSPGAFALARFEGRLSVEVGEGSLLEVEPGGGGRVLGLISLAEIPRRLTLDFSDFFDKGFAFNTVSGEFVFADGRAHTDGLRIDGPAAEIRVSGATDLRRQEYDQRIEVLPKAGGVLPAIGAIAGGPVGAAVGAMAQAVLQKPLKQAARTVYHVTGPWKEPKVEVIEKGPPPTPRGDAQAG